MNIYRGVRIVCRRGYFLLASLLTVLDSFVDILGDLDTHGLVHNEFIEGCDLLGTIRADEVPLEEVRLYALLTVHGAATRGLHRVAEQFVVNRTRERRICGRSFADLGS